MTNDLISREALKKLMWDESHSITTFTEYGTQVARMGLTIKEIEEIIDNAPTVEVPEDEVNCVLTMFGKCSYNETGCSDCEIKDKIRKALNGRPQGEWQLHGMIYYCSECGHECGESSDNFCGNCGADMRGISE